MSMTLRVRLFWMGTLVATILGVVLVYRLAGDHGWVSALLGVSPALVALAVSRYWPRCPFCHVNVIDTRSDWVFPPKECSNCGQSYDGPFRTPDQLEARDHEEYVRLFGRDE